MPCFEIREHLAPRPRTFWWRSIHFGFRLLYNELAWSYDSVSWLVSLGKWRQWQKASIQYLTGSRVLEIAHGPGHMLIQIHASGFEAFGLDLSISMVRQAQKRMAQIAAPSRLIRGSALALPYKSGSFDSVLMTFPAEFVVCQETISGIYRILVPGGRLVILPDARLTGTGRIHRFIDWCFVITGQRESARSHLRRDSTRLLLANVLEKSGFSVETHLFYQEDSEINVLSALKQPMTDVT